MEQYIIFIIWLTIFAIISYRRLDSGICLVVFTLPCYLLRLKIFGIPTTVLELEIYLLFLVWLTGQAKDKKFSERLKKIKTFFTCHLSFVIAVVLILSGATLSTIFSSNLRVSLGILKGWFFDPLIFSAIIFFTLKTRKQIISILSALAVSGFFVAVISLFYYFLGDLTFDGRLRAFYLSPNHLAMYLAPGLFIIPYLLPNFRKNLSKSFWLFGIVLIAAALYLTYSYGAWFGIFGSLFFLSLFFLRGKTKIFSIFGLVAFIIILVFFQLNSPKFKNLIESPRSPLHSRLMVWQSAFEIGKDNLILGIGPGMFQEYYLNYQKYFPPYLEWAVPQPHNLFLAFWLQSGILGLIGFFWLIFWFFKTGFKLLVISHWSLVIIPMTIMVYTLIHGLVDTTYWKNDLSLIFWLTIALMTGLANIKIRSNQAPK